MNNMRELNKNLLKTYKDLDEEIVVSSNKIPRDLQMICL